MQGYIARTLEREVIGKLSHNPVTAILGPRQCGKSTLAKKVIEHFDNAVYLDLERASDRAKLRDPEAFFALNNNRLMCLDEIQRMPKIFEAIRPAVDEDGAPRQFLILGSASRDLIAQSSETLAGRISYLELTPFTNEEIPDIFPGATRRLLLRGGFPRSFLAQSDQASFEWRMDFVRTFIERDLPFLSSTARNQRMERLWRMCAHYHGQLLNSSSLSGSLGVSNHTVRSHLELLEQTFVLRLLLPFQGNMKKRLVKSPKLYIRDVGILNALLDIRDHNSLLGHPQYGAAWEGLVIEQIAARVPDAILSFYRTGAGAEADLVVERAGRRVVLECKVSTAPTVSRGFWNVVEDLSPDEVLIVAPVDSSYPFKGATVVPLGECLERL